jgi:hypothetical protein
MELESSHTINHPWIGTKASCFFIPPTAKAARIPQNPDHVSSQPHCFPSLAIWLFDCIWLCGHTLPCACYGLHAGFRGSPRVLVHLLLLPCLRKVSLVCAAAHGLVSGAFPVSTAQCFLWNPGISDVLLNLNFYMSSEDTDTHLLMPVQQALHSLIHFPIP